MKISKITKRLFLWLYLTVPLIALGQSSWKLEKDKDEIKVYTREEEESAYKSFKASTSLEATPLDILEILSVPENYPNWYGYTEKAYLIKKIDNIQYNYVETIFPWPFSNRDMVYKMEISIINHAYIIITLKGLPDFIPIKEGVERMKRAEGSILLTAIKEGTTITYQFHSDPGDDVPPWLANSTITELPYQTLIGLRKILK